MNQGKICHISGSLFTRAQGQEETITAYLMDLNNKAKNCKFGDLCDSLVRDRIVCGRKVARRGRDYTG